MSDFVELLHLKWNGHSNGIAKAFLQSFMNEQLVDVTLSCQGQLFRVHKLILSASSPYFEMLFRLHQQRDIVIIINSMPVHHLRLLIEFIYTGEIKLKEHELIDFLQAAEQLQIKSLSDVLQRKAKRENFKNRKRRASINNVNLNDVPVENIEDNNENISKESCSNIPGQTLAVSSMQQDLSESTSQNNLPVNSSNDSEETNPLMMYKPLAIVKEEPLSPVKINTENETVEELNEKVDAIKTIDSKIEPKIRRPQNAFMVFASRWRKQLAKQHSEDSNKQISVRLGQKWHNLEADEKAEYFTESRKVHQEHKLKYPGYNYNPKSKKRKLKKPAATDKKKRLKKGLPAKLPDNVSKGALEQYESSESADDPKPGSTSEYKPELSDVINAVLGMGVTNCIIENNNVVTKADFEQT